jgi:hypothetical protein
MINQLKWDAIDLWKRVGWVILSIPFIMLLVLLPTNSGKPANLIFLSMVSLISSVEIVFLFLLGNLVSLQWLLGHQAQLHFSVSTASWKMLLSKLFLALILNIFACFITLQIMLFVGKYSTGTFRWISAQDLYGIPEIILLLSVINVTGVFGNLLARSISWARSHTTIYTLMFGFIILFVLAFLAMFAYYPLWIGLLLVFLLLEFFGSILLMHRYAHLD